MNTQEAHEILTVIEVLKEHAGEAENFSDNEKCETRDIHGVSVTAPDWFLDMLEYHVERRLHDNPDPPEFEQQVVNIHKLMEEVKGMKNGADKEKSYGVPDGRKPDEPETTHTPKGKRHVFRYENEMDQVFENIVEVHPHEEGSMVLISDRGDRHEILSTWISHSIYQNS